MADSQNLYQDLSDIDVKPEDIHMPPNSFWPIVLALGFVLILGGLAMSLPFILVGVLMVLVSAIGWVVEPGYEAEEHH